jgi:hypothetical protein
MGSDARAGSSAASVTDPVASDAGALGALLVCGIVVGPLYLAVGLAQALWREGFVLSRHPLSVLANGPGGWVQTANFVVCGLMVIAAAVGLARAWRPQSRAIGWVLGTFGASMIAAAAFRADPVDGFPPGTPIGMPTTISTSGLLHFAFGGIGFLALAVSCLVAARAMSRRRESGMARFAFFSGVAVLVGFFLPMVAPNVSVGTAGIWFSVVMGWLWLSLTSLRLYRAA